MSLTTEPRPGLPRDCFSLVNWSKVPRLIISSRGGERVPFILIWLRLLGRHCAKRLILWMLTKKEPEGEPAPARQTGCYSWIHQNIPLDVVERGERIFSFPPHLSAWCLPESAAPCWSSKDPRSFPAKWLQFVIRAVCPWRFSAGSLASPSLRPGHRWCPYPPSTFKRRAQGQAVSAGKFLGLSIFLRSQRSPPGPLFMWDIMLFHFPLVILLPWRELDSWYNYMLGQFPVKVTPCRCPIPGPESTALGQKPGGPLCRAGNDSVLGGHFALTVLRPPRGQGALDMSDSPQSQPVLWSLGPAARPASFSSVAHKMVPGGHVFQCLGFRLIAQKI